MQFLDPADHLQAELQRLDLLLHREILRLRATYQLSLDEFRGLYVSDEQVDRLAASPLRDPASNSPADDSQPIEELTARAAALRTEIDSRIGRDLPWSRVVLEWNLTPFEQDVLLLGLAPEVDLKYETLLAYLNNDVTRKWPTCDLALRLFAPNRARDLTLRRQLSPTSALFRDGLLQAIRPGPERVSSLALGFNISPLVSQFLLGLPGDDSATAEFLVPSANAIGDQETLPAGLQEHFERVETNDRDSASWPSPLIILEGRTGRGRRAAARAVCAGAGVPLFEVDLEALRVVASRPGAETLSRLLESLVLQQRLAGALLCLMNVESLWDKDGHLWSEARRMIERLCVCGRPLFLICNQGTSWQGLCRGLRCLSFSLADPDFGTRCAVWDQSLAAAGACATRDDVAMVAGRFFLMPDQIRSAVRMAVDERSKESEDGSQIALDLLLKAARAKSIQSLGSLAAKVHVTHGWNDLVLPDETMQQVRALATAIRHRHVVYAEWGFGRRIPNGQGMKVLFAGPSGTGKTMTAGVIAAELGLDLYRIDLSAVVSKYIGETEKHLERIFRSAHCSNAVLFFDEADALFGKRSEVKDAHDRYANVETAYLLQRIEEHEGIVILASNLTNNIDDAFRRRLHYVVDFPLPDEPEREKLWRGMLPPEMPLGDDVDLRFLAKQFPLAGGDIRNVALDAAFQAASNGRILKMRQLVQAVARQMRKQGTVPSASEFKQHYATVTEAR